MGFEIKIYDDTGKLCSQYYINKFDKLKRFLSIEDLDKKLGHEVRLLIETALEKIRDEGYPIDKDVIACHGLWQMHVWWFAVRLNQILDIAVKYPYGRFDIS